jgi:hypothetical protein
MRENHENIMGNCEKVGQKQGESEGRHSIGKGIENIAAKNDLIVPEYPTQEKIEEKSALISPQSALFWLKRSG